MARTDIDQDGAFVNDAGERRFFVYKGIRVSDMDKDTLVVALTDALLEQDRLRAEIDRRNRETMDAAFARAGFPFNPKKPFSL